ncbi:hypothetical protein [Chromobacterium haemolyticum]|uniref:Uncharacterized protein n=1 Tax=Chromobacterium haemolyticum TaxID=394935 RepID=A0A1W0CCZ3_9NEIS|nr:hypothetical protein [Chromobacterium haemolyticum]OQS32584.1 hypothetical protein B0T45_21520 [Chromobacterium haemolyticum]
MSLQHVEQSPVEVLAERLNRLPAGKVIVVSTPGAKGCEHVAQMYDSQQVKSLPWQWRASVPFDEIDALED